MADRYLGEGCQLHRVREPLNPVAPGGSCGASGDFDALGGESVRGVPDVSFGCKGFKRLIVSTGVKLHSESKR